MIWALRTGILHLYLILVLFFVIGYLAGIAGYLFGRYLNTTRLYRYVRYRFSENGEASQ